MVNKVILLGNVGKDPEVRYFDNGGSVASFTLATNETFKNKQGDKQALTEWHNINVFGKLAEIAEKYVKKGEALYLEGKIKTEKHNDKYYTKIKPLMSSEFCFFRRFSQNSCDLLPFLSD